MIDAYIKAEIDPLAILEGIKKAMQNKIMRKVLTAVSKPILSAAKQSAPKRTGGLKFSLATKIKTTKDRVFAVIGAKTNYRKTKGGITVRPVRYAHLQEKGWKYGTAHPFLKPNFNATSVQEQIRQQIANEIASITK